MTLVLDELLYNWRSEVIDFLHPLGTETLVLLMLKHPIEEFAWIAYALPFRTNVWLFLFLNSIPVFITFQLFHYYSENSSLNPLNVTIKTLSCYWAVLMTYLAKVPVMLSQSRFFSVRWMIFVVLFTGNYIFMCYRASLTSELSVRRKPLPFDSMTKLLNSDYV